MPDLDALERRSPTVYTTMANLESKPGPRVAKYAMPLDAGGALFKWVPEDSDTADDLNVLEHTAGFDGRWHRVREAKKGTNLTAAAEDIGVGGNRLRVIPAATLSANVTKTLVTTNATSGDEIRVTRHDTGAYTVAFVDDATSATLLTMPVSVKYYADFYFNGTSWEVTAAGTFASG